MQSDGFGREMGRAAGAHALGSPHYTMARRAVTRCPYQGNRGKWCVVANTRGIVCLGAERPTLFY